MHDVGAVLVAEVRSRSSVGSRVGAVVKNATRLPSTGSTGRGRSTVATTGTSLTSRDRLGERARWRRAVLGHGQDDEVGDEDAVRVEVAGDELGRLVRARDEDARPRRDRRERRAAAVEDDEVGLALGARVARPRRRSSRRRAGEPAAAAPAADRRHAGERRVSR